VNRQQRRRAKRSADRAAGIASVHWVTADRIKISYVNPADFILLVAAASRGGTEENALCNAVEQTLRRVARAPAHSSRLCGSCPAEIRGTAFLILVAAPLGGPLAGSPAVCTTLCPRCQIDIATNTLIALRRLWPKAAYLTTHPGSPVVQ
jgi:hypothetical protein